MRLLQLCTKVPYPPKDGGAAGVFVYSKAFSDLGHTVDIVAVNPPKHFIGEDQYKALPENIHIHAVSMDTSPVWWRALVNLLFSLVPYQVERFSNTDFTKQLISVLKQSQFDVIQMEGIYLCPYLPVIRRFSNASVVLRAHNIEGSLWKDIAANETTLMKRFYLSILARRMKRYEIEQFSQFDAVTSVTSKDLDYVKAHRPLLKADLFPYAIEIKPFTLTPINRKAIYFLGALDWMPNQEAIRWFAAEVWPKIFQAFPNIRFHVAGRNAAKSLADFLEGIEGIVYSGEVADAGAFLRQFSIMVSPLFSGSGIRVKIIEAMQQGVVVLASAKAVEGIEATPGQHLLLAETSEDYILHLHRLFSESGLIEQIGADARQLICEKFDILAITRNLIDFYDVHPD
jgi:polysaccharide biosynthesis protein PslH